MRVSHDWPLSFFFVLTLYKASESQFTNVYSVCLAQFFKIN